MSGLFDEILDCVHGIRTDLRESMGMKCATCEYESNKSGCSTCHGRSKWMLKKPYMSIEECLYAIDYANRNKTG